MRCPFICWHLCFWCLVLLVQGCKASVNSEVNLSLAGNKRTSASSSDTPFPEASASVTTTTTDYFGVARHLTLRSEHRSASCRCLVAAVGTAASAAFDWHNKQPSVGSDALVVAIGRSKHECKIQGRGPSIAGFEKHGNDIIVTVEHFRDARPIVLGAIVPNPGPEGFVYIKPLANTIYGASLDSSNRSKLCRIGQGY